MRLVLQGVGPRLQHYYDRDWQANEPRRTRLGVIGETGIIRDKPGFEVDFITRASATDTPHSHDHPSVLMPVKGHWRVTWDGGEIVLAPGDTMSVPEGLSHAATPSMTGEAALYHIVATDDPAGPTWKG